MINFSTISWSEHISYWWNDGDGVLCVLDQLTDLNSSWKQQSKSRDMLIHPDTLSWLRTNRSVVLHDVCLTDKYHFYSLMDQVSNPWFFTFKMNMITVTLQRPCYIMCDEIYVWSINGFFFLIMLKKFILITTYVIKAIQSWLYVSQALPILLPTLIILLVKTVK